MANRTRWFVAVLAAACSILLAACDGGSGGGGSCTHVVAPKTGPGDTDLYFPAAVGWSWTYTVDGTSTAIMTVSGTQVVNGETASIFSSSGGADMVVKLPVGAYLVSSTDATPPLDQALPQLLLPFPVAVTGRSQQVTCSNLTFVESGVTVRADLVLYVEVLSVTETATIAAGSFTDLAHVQTTGDLTMLASGQTVSATIVEDSWYAPEVGRVNSQVTLTIPGYGSQTSTLSLTSYSPPTATSSTADGPVAAAVSRSAEPVASSPEELAFRLARRLARIGR